MIGAFLSTYIWGNPGGLGPSRARRIITGIHTRDNYLAPEISYVRERLLTGALLVQKSGAVEGFRYMNNEGYIKYLRAAFFTKWLSYSSMVHSVDGEEVVPILDKRVRDWIEATTEGRENLSTTSTADYSRYVDILGAWGSESKRSRVQVELEIFRLTAK